MKHIYQLLTAVALLVAVPAGMSAQIYDNLRPPTGSAKPTTPPKPAKPKPSKKPRQSVTTPHYNWKETGPFIEGLARVKNDEDKYGFINKKDELVIPCRFQGAQNFSDGMAAVYENRRCGFIDTAGTLVVPYQWTYTSGFSDGLALVKDDNDKCGYIDKTGTLVIPCQFDFGLAESFHDGLAAVGIIAPSALIKWGFIDKTGTLVIPHQWRETEGFRDGMAAVMDGPSQKWGLIDTTGKLLTPYEWKKISYRWSRWVAVGFDDKEHFIDHQTGKVVE